MQRILLFAPHVLMQPHAFSQQSWLLVLLGFIYLSLSGITEIIG